MCKQMTDVKLLLLHRSFQDRLTVCKQMIRSRMICIEWVM